MKQWEGATEQKGITSTRIHEVSLETLQITLQANSLQLVDGIPGWATGVRLRRRLFPFPRPLLADRAAVWAHSSFIEPGGSLHVHCSLSKHLNTLVWSACRRWAGRWEHAAPTESGCSFGQQSVQSPNSRWHIHCSLHGCPSLLVYAPKEQGCALLGRRAAGDP